MKGFEGSKYTSIPKGYCQCGCGQKTKLAPNTSRRDGWIKGEPLQYIHGHNGRGKKRLISEEWRKNISVGQRKRFSNPENHPRWNGGKIIHEGYIFLKKPNHPRANNHGYVKRCVLNVEDKLGIILSNKFNVHHINGNKQDDRLKNLAILTHAGHSYLHGKMRGGLNHG